VTKGSLRLPRSVVTGHITRERDHCSFSTSALPSGLYHRDQSMEKKETFATSALSLGPQIRKALLRAVK
jgi:hypothetical protein